MTPPAVAAAEADAPELVILSGNEAIARGALGYPTIYVGVVIPPFDCVSDYYRGMRGSTTDMFRRPEKLVARVENVMAMSEAVLEYGVL